MKISVAMATYNGNRYIRQQLDSIVRQSVLPDELIISDDGSQDNTVDICKDFSRSAPFPVSIMINADKLGYARNFEQAINSCNGDILFLCDQDDYWFNNKIEFMSGYFNKSDSIGLVYCNAIYTDQNLIPTKYSIFNTSGFSELYKGNDRSIFDIAKNPKIKGCTTAINSRYLPYLFPIVETKPGEFWGHDYQITFLLNSFSNVIAIDTPLMYYRIHENNTSQKKKLKVATNNKFIWRKKNLKYPSNMIENYVNKYSFSLKVFSSIKKSDVSYSCNKLTAMEELVNNELVMLKKRYQIMSETISLYRYRLILFFLFQGNYFRFKRWLGAFIKDVVHAYH